MSNEKLRESPKVTIHRGISKPVGNSEGYHYFKLCENEHDKGFGLGLSWNNSEVTCEKCLEIMKISNLSTSKHETVEELKRFIISWRLVGAINEPSRDFYVECKNEKEARELFENSHNMEVSLITGVCDMVNVFATAESHGKPEIEG